jgi:hypothetical protein
LASSCGVVVSEDGSLMEAVDGLALYLEKQQVGVLAKRV